MAAPTIREPRRAGPPAARAGGAVARVLRVLACVAFALCAAAAPAEARPVQSGTLSGRVTDDRALPVPLASVTARGSSEARSTRTGADGRYTLELPAGADFVVTVERVGFITTTVLVERGTAPRLVRDFRLNPTPVALAPVVGQAARSMVEPIFQRETPGESSYTELGVVTERFPNEPGDLAGIAALTPGVSLVGGGDDDPPGISIAGQSPSANRTVVDGAAFGGASLPREAVARAGVVTSLYDVSRGQFTGGLVTATTRGGTNIWGGAASASVRPPIFQYGVRPTSNLGERYSSGRLDAGGGGPIIHERLFAFGAAQWTRRAAGVPFLDAGDGDALRRIGVDADSVRRFYGILERAGIAAGSAPRSLSDAGSAVARFDLLMGDDHQAVLRFDWRGTRAQGLGASPLAVPSGAAGSRRSDGGVMAQLTSRWGRMENELRAYGTGGSSRSSSSLYLPTAYVRVTSGADDAAGLASLRFGGSALAFGRARRSLVEVSDQAAVATRGDAHRVTLGGHYVAESASVRGGGNPLGTFTFNSLAELEARRPAAFSRTLGMAERTMDSRTAALYLGDLWRVGRGLRLTYGARVEGSRYGAPAAYDSAAAALFGARPGRVPDELRVSPRAGFALDLPARHLTLHGGAGEFRGRIAPSALAALAGGAGEVEVACVAAAAPVPDWERYAADAGAIPTACVEGAPAFARRAPRATLFDSEFAAPRVWNGSLGGRWVAGGRHFIDFNLTVVRGRAQPVTTDRNLDAAPEFGLANEGGRPVFVPATAIDPASGGAAPLASRRHPEVGTALWIDSRGRSASEQLTLAASTLTRSTGAVSLSYAFTRSRDMATGFSGLGGGFPSTAGDPGVLDWAPTDFEQRHAVQLYILHRFSRSLGFTAVARVASGLPYTPLVEGDVNGDGSFNDRAFVFRSTVADTILAGGLGLLAADAPASALACLNGQRGRVADRNSCRTPWTASLDVKAALRPRRMGTPGRFSLTVTGQNVTAGLDYLLHGGDDLRGWGQYPAVDATLLRIRGFDPATRAYAYEVNPAFGTLAGTRSRFRTPFTVVVEGRVTLGADPAYQPLARMVNRLRGSPRARDDARAVLAEQIPNLPANILAASDSLGLGLTPGQVERLRASADSLGAAIAAVADSLSGVLAAPARESRAAARVRAARVRELSDRARALIDAGGTSTRAVLTPEQWDRVPPALRSPARGDLVGPRQLQIGEPGG